jgi:hypothetical protein
MLIKVWGGYSKGSCVCANRSNTIAIGGQFTYGVETAGNIRRNLFV